MPELVHWNPWRRLADHGALRRVRLPLRTNNFGDLLGPIIVNRLVELEGLGAGVSRRQRLLTVGSIVHFARPGDVIWGSGINGKVSTSVPERLDIRAVRGPLTARAIRAAGHDVPEVFGDPALLLPRLWSDEELGVERRSGGVLVVPNLHDVAGAPSGSISPVGDPLAIVRRIASADRVVSSSLHGIVVAEAFGVPVVPVQATQETGFKYEDYFEGTGRSLPAFARSWDDAIDHGDATPPLDWDPSSLLASFPADLWRGTP